MRSPRTVLRGFGIAVVVGAALVSSCGRGSPVAGRVGGACLAGSGCDDGLLCLSEICVQPAAADAGRGVGGEAPAAATGGAGGGALGMACTAATTMLAPASALIADFTGGKGNFEVAAGIYTYPPGSAAAPAYSLLDGVLHVTENAPATSETQYLGLAIGFNDCIDATAFSGVSFTISGSLSGCTMQYGTGDVEHQDSTTDAYLATGPAGSYPPQTTLTADEITAAPQTLTMPFISNTIFGSPQTPIDKTKLVLLLWQFTVPAASPATAGAMPAACVADITIDNVSFY